MALTSYNTNLHELQSFMLAWEKYLPYTMLRKEIEGKTHELGYYNCIAISLLQ